MDVMTFLQPVWSFLSVVIIAWTTQRIIAYRERRQKIDDAKMSVYMSWLPFLAECYARAVYPDSEPYDQREFLKRQMEILGTLQIIGPEGAMEAFTEFSDMVQLGFRNDASFDPETLHRNFSRLNYCLCCEIHGEREDATAD